MTAEQFTKVLEEQIDRTRKVLDSKAVEYADDVDRLANFKAAAALQGTNQADALGGMMAKHTVSIYDMLATRAQEYTSLQWEEKITDHINYLILLRAVVQEERDNLCL